MFAQRPLFNFTMKNMNICWEGSHYSKINANSTLQLLIKKRYLFIISWSLLLLSTCSCSFCLGSTSDFLYSSLNFLSLLSWCSFWFIPKFVSFKKFLLIVLLSWIKTIINKSESWTWTSSKLGLETEDCNLFWLRLELSSKFFFKSSFWDVSSIWVNNFN